MPTFHVTRTFKLPERKLFVMAGSVLEGESLPGMFGHMPCNSSLDITARIQSIEKPRRLDADDVWLCIEEEPDEVDLLSALNVSDETLESTIEGSD